MAYNAVAQADEVASHSGSDLSRSPSPAHGTFQQLHDADHLDGSLLASAQTSDKAGLDLASMIRSMTSTSYDVVEDDDYDADPSPDQRSSSLRAIPPLNTAIARHSSPEPPLHSASSDIPPPLNHPTPDLQSLQGAYTGNVERLEMTAERLSCSSTDIGSEIRKMDQEQKRRSCSSASNSIIMRNGAFSPVTVASAHGSTFSTRQRSVSGASRLPQVTEPDHDENGHYADHLPTPLPILPAPQPQIYSHTSEVYHNQHAGNNGSEEFERPASAASGDTFHQARTLFNDFDGVHFTPLEHAASGRQISLIQPPLASKPESYKAPQAGDQMVYYPAPVPRMLNLPPKLSRRPIIDHEKRRTQLMNSIAAEDKLAEQERARNTQKDKGQSSVPQQLRASVFFDPPSAPLDIQVKQDSAVATLDSILDASTYAPVSAFTDHPFAGHIGSHVYGNSKRKTLAKIPPGERPERNSQYQMGQPQSKESEEGPAYLGDGVHQHDDHHRSQDETSGSETETVSGSHESEDNEEEYEEEDYVGPPNTLLAELQLRKHELKQRTRTAVPTTSQAQVMGATLLEMDELAQKQSEKRRRRPVTLAWDGHNNADDEDVPLAMLYPDKTNVDDENKPVGLMAKREMEENEPLSTRRARLRGEPIPEKRPVTVYSTMEIKPEKPQSESEEDNGNEAETLAERLRRLKGQNPEESDFTSGLMAEFDTRAGNAPKETPKPSDTAPEQEETLAQRRSRLQRENINKRPGVHSQNLHNRRSMAALPQSRPAYVARQSSYDVFPQQRGVVPQLGHRASMYSLPVNMASQGYPMAQPSGYGMPYPSVYPYNNMGYPSTCGPTLRQPLEPGQQDVIDRWRQSIR